MDHEDWGSIFPDIRERACDRVFIAFLLRNAASSVSAPGPRNGAFQVMQLSGIGIPHSCIFFGSNLTIVDSRKGILPLSDLSDLEQASSPALILVVSLSESLA
jgi:hypothetical protein